MPLNTTDTESLGTMLVDRDRGLGTAYERWCFYQLVDKWAAEYGVESVLEGPVDGMAGVRGVHSAGLARKGISVVSAVPKEASAAVARAVFATVVPPASASKVDVVVTDPATVDQLRPSDMVVVYHALPFVQDWHGYLRALGKLARKVLVVAACNPDNWGFKTVSLLGRTRAPDVWTTETLAPVLWEMGHVREHVYFDAPWWPDLPVAPGQSLADRLKHMLFRRQGARFAPQPDRAVLATKYVYGPGRWPYFGGPGWVDELEPALLRHPAFEGASPKIVRRVAHLHAFVVDMRPRTPQQRRRLVQVREQPAEP